MVNPVVCNKKKSDDAKNVNINNNNSTMKRSLDQSEASEASDKKKLMKFQNELLEDNIDYLALKSSLSLLQSRLFTIKKDIKELNNFKKSIWDSEDGKTLHQLIVNNSDYLKEINYKGSVVKCPSIQWNKTYGLNLESLSNETYETINENYEIIKKDQLFK